MTSHDTPIDEFAVLLETTRLKQGLTQDDLALAIRAALGDRCTYQQVSNWERGVGRPTKKRLYAIIEILKLDKRKAAEAFTGPTLMELRTREALEGPVQKRAAKDRRQHPPNQQPPPNPKPKGKK